MDIIQRFLMNTCTIEQQTLIADSINTIENFGLVDINLNLEELGQLLENNDTFEIIQTCYTYIRRYQHMAFDAMGIQIDCEDIAASNALLANLSIIEESDEHVLISELLDNAQTPQDGFLELLEKVCYADLTQFEHIIQRVPTEFVERIYNLHFSPMQVLQAEGKITVPEVDGRKKTLLLKIWSDQQINSIKQFVYNDELNLPISEHVIFSKFRDELRALKGVSDRIKIVYKLLEVVLIGKTEWKDIKQKIRSLAKELYGDDPMFIAELSYQIDNVCMREKINGSF